MSSRSSQVCKALGAVVLPLMVGIAGNWAIMVPASQAIAHTIQDRKAEADGLIQKGMKYQQFSQYHEALRAYEAALAIYQTLRNTREEARTLNNIGQIYSSLQEYEKATKSYHSAIEPI